jgi:hypothetical protein
MAFRKTEEGNYSLNWDHSITYRRSLRDWIFILFLLTFLPVIIRLGLSHWKGKPIIDERGA